MFNNPHPVKHAVIAVVTAGGRRDAVRKSAVFRVSIAVRKDNGNDLGGIAGQPACLAGGRGAERAKCK